MFFTIIFLISFFKHFIITCLSIFLNVPSRILYTHTKLQYITHYYYTITHDSLQTLSQIKHLFTKTQSAQIPIYTLTKSSPLLQTKFIETKMILYKRINLLNTQSKSYFVVDSAINLIFCFFRFENCYDLILKSRALFIEIYYVTANTVLSNFRQIIYIDHG